MRRYLAIIGTAPIYCPAERTHLLIRAGLENARTVAGARRGDCWTTENTAYGVEVRGGKPSPAKCAVHAAIHEHEHTA